MILCIADLRAAFPGETPAQLFDRVMALADCPTRWGDPAGWMDCSVFLDGFRSTTEMSYAIH